MPAICTRRYNTRVKAVWAVAFVLFCGTASLVAHHSFAAEYDGAQPVTIGGVVTRIDWTNPHFHFYVDVKDDSGVVVQWKFEGYPPNMLIRQGWKRDVTLKPGDAVTVFGWKARADPVPRCRSRDHVRRRTQDDRRTSGGDRRTIGALECEDLRI